MLTHFYDIECLDNVFTICDFKPEENCIDCYHLIDTQSLYTQTQTPDFANKLHKRIISSNANFNGSIRVFDLRIKEHAQHLAQTFGLSTAKYINNPNAPDLWQNKYRIVCDTDPNYDADRHPFLFGYNSYNYDTTILAELFHDMFWNSANDPDHFHVASARAIRTFSDSLFSDQFKKQMPQRLTYNSDTWDQNWNDPRWTIRKNMLMSGRHLDVARLNEKQMRVGLKRLLGMLGHQILESDKLATGASQIDSIDQLLDLFAYNASDVINLNELFKHPFYQGQFNLKKGLLQTYPELIYEEIPGEYKPDIDPTKVRRDRLTIDSSSAQFATKALCPYGHLSDLETVSFVYPADRKCEELRAQGIDVHQVNVLEESRKFFYKHLGAYPDACAAFDKIYDYYKSIEGKNFNDSDFYKEDYGQKHDNQNGQTSYILPPHLLPRTLASIDKVETCIPYFNIDGTPSSCFVTFSTGGIHGAEYNKALYEADLAAWKEKMSDMSFVQSVYPDPLDLRRAKKVEINGVEHKWSEFIKAGMTIKKMEAILPDERKQICYRDFAADKPVIFKRLDNGSTELNKKYAFTSYGLTNHEDFTSYYPNMLRMLSAFYNPGLGYDRYGEIFDNKTEYGKKMKDKSLSQKERDYYDVLRDGTKLILNTASGAGDTNYGLPIQMNNRIISMRIIGQLFTWRIGQAQTLAGARMPSTNTDGLYSVMEETLNNKILAAEAADIGVEIEPEPIYLISKDTNNRLEFDPTKGKIVSVSGGSLACYHDTNPTKSLAHPAIIDWALGEYLLVAAMGYKSLSIEQPFNEEIGRSILASSLTQFKDKAHLLRMFSHVLASSTGSINYIFGQTDDAPEKPIILQHYNRVFIVKDKTPGSMHLKAANAKIITEAMRNKRSRENERPQQHDPVAMQILAANGVNVSTLPYNKEAVIKNVTNINSDWYMLVENRSLIEMPESEQQRIIDTLDFEKYLSMLANTYENNWRNQTVS